MGWLRRGAGRMRRDARIAAGSRSMDPVTLAHLTEFAQTHRGVEAFIEPPTTISRTTMLLVDITGAWTRRVIPSDVWGYRFAEKLQVPGYDAAVVGYPQRMREYNARKRRGEA